MLALPLLFSAPLVAQSASPAEQQRSALIARTTASLVTLTATIKPEARAPRPLPGFSKRTCANLPSARWDEATKTCTQSFDMVPAREQREQGSGFLFDAARGLILTAPHIAGKGNLTARLPDGRTVAAELLAADSDIGLAVVRIAPDEVARARMMALPLADTPPVAGHDALLVGRSIPLDSLIGIGGQVIGVLGPDNLHDSDTRGRSMPVFAPQFLLNIRLPDGSLGGTPVLDSSGKAAGLLLAIFGLAGDNPASLMVGLAGQKDRIAELAEGKTRARSWLGVNIDCPDQRCEVKMVTPESPAAVAGVQSGDMLIAVNGQPVRSSFALMRIVRAAPPGTAFALTVERYGSAIPDINVISADLSSVAEPDADYPFDIPEQR